MNISWGVVAVLIPIVTAVLIAVYRLGRMESMFEKYITKTDCDVRYLGVTAAVQKLTADTRAFAGESKEQIKSLFEITQRQERAVERLEDVNRANGGG